MRAMPAQRRSSDDKFGGGGAAQWRRMSLPAMLLCEQTPRKVTAEQTPFRALRARVKQSQRGATRAEAYTPPSCGRVRSRIHFKPTSPLGCSSVTANRVSPKNRPWAKKTVMFPNPMFLASTSPDARFL